jgi:hypothetical protein
MKHKSVVRLLALLAVVAAVIGAYIKGRNDVLIAEFKQYSANLLALTQYETNQPPELKDFVKARYYYLANRTPKSWVGRPYDYGAVSTNLVHLTCFKGPTSAQEEYRLFLERFSRLLSDHK